MVHEQAPNAYTTIPLTLFQNKRIAVDANNFAYIYYEVSQKKVIFKTDLGATKGEFDKEEVRKEWFRSIVEWVIIILSYGCIPVFCFDGDASPKKTATREKRKGSKDKLKKEIELLKQQLNTNDPLIYDAQAANELKKKLPWLAYVSKKEIDDFKALLGAIGIPCLQGKQCVEGEGLCSILCREGKVFAAFSNDTDTIAYKCPISVSKFGDYYVDPTTNQRVHQFEGVIYDRILQGLNMTAPFLTELCIMAGCDFNTNIPRVAMITAMKLLKDYGTIENIGTIKDISCLDHQYCREVFSYKPSEGMIESGEYNHIPTIQDLAKDGIRELLESFHVDGYISRLVNIYRQITPDNFKDISSNSNLHLDPPPVEKKVILKIKKKEEVPPLPMDMSQITFIRCKDPVVDVSYPIKLKIRQLAI